MPSPFESPKRRLRRAKEHTKHINTRLDKFFKKEPYARVVETDPDSGDQIHKFKLTKSIPEKVTDLTYDAIEALRSSLDQATYAVAIACGAKRPDLVHFPIADDAVKFEKLLKTGQVKDFPPEILTLFRGFEPYQGRNDAIWALNRIRRQGYHRLIVPVGMTTQKITYNHLMISGGGSLFSPKWDAEKNEIIFATTRPGAEFDYNVTFSLFVAFGEVEGVAGNPVISTLAKMLDEASRFHFGG